MNVTAKPRVALFDLDHTLLPIDSDYSWGLFTSEIGWTDPVTFRERNNEFYEQYKKGALDIHDYVRFATEAVRLKGAEEAAAAHLDFMHSVVKPALRRESLDLLQMHREAGDIIVIVTATNEFVTRPIAAALRVDELIAVELERGADGWITGEIRGVASAREGKVVRVEQWLAARGWQWSDAHTVFYSDSINDLALLEKVDEPVATNPDDRLRAIAAQRGWRILDLFPQTTMIKRFIDKLLGKPAAKPARPDFGKRREVGPQEHKIDPSLVDDRALNVVHTLKEAGFLAYIVGGAVRDLLVGLRPKDFDVATDATPEQVKGLFRRAFIIGRRFRIVHVVYGRGREHEVIEVSTFRAHMDNAAAEQVAGNEKTSRNELAGMKHAVDASGRVLRDNVWGPQEEDATRRDFTINAMYYDPETQTVVDYHNGIKDAQKRLLRMIGDPLARYREDPVRMIRAVRFAAKLSPLGFKLDAKTAAPLSECRALLADVPQSRLFDEMLKLLQTGHSIATIAQLKKLGLATGIYPLLDLVVERADETFVKAALQDTDRRVQEGKPVAPSFLLASVLWSDVRTGWADRLAKKQHPFPALQDAIDDVFNARIGDVSGRGKLGADMREIWMMQPRFEKRVGHTPFSLVEQPRFRAGFDFMRLRADTGEIDVLLADWWEEFSQASDAVREDLVAQLREEQNRNQRRVRSAKPMKADDDVRGESVKTHQSSSVETETGDAGNASGESDAASSAPRKRRRRRRKPSGGGAATSAPDDGAQD